MISHEIGHSYGLSDIYVSEADPTFSGLKSTDETNLMNYITPIGPKIRYRPLEVVYTSRNERIKRDGKYATESQWECIRSKKMYRSILGEWKNAKCYYSFDGCRLWTFVCE